jgi:hypothetical protein
MMIVTDAILVQGGRTGGTNPPDDSLLGQDPQGVIHRLSRNGTDLGANRVGNVIGRTVRLLGHGPQHRNPLSRNLESMLSK